MLPSTRITEISWSQFLLGKESVTVAKVPLKKEHLAKIDNLTPGAWEFRESRQKHPWVCHITRMWYFLLSFSFNFHNVATHMWTRNQDNQNINWLLQMFSPWNKNYLNSILAILVYWPSPKSMFCQAAERQVCHRKPLFTGNKILSVYTLKTAHDLTTF